MPDDRLAAAAAELYGADQEAFTDRRKALAASARAAGDKSAATAITALRKPTRAAWVVNRLARADPSAPPRLAELAAALRDAQQSGDGPRLRELSAARGRLIDALTAQALAAADVADPPPALRLEVAQTITAALADPEVAAAFAAGTLTRAVQWSGFGLAPADTSADSGAGADVDSGASTGAGPGAGASQGHAPGAGTAPDEDVRAVPPQRGAATRTAARRETPGQRQETPAQRRKAAARRQAEEAQRREAAAQQVAADQAARRRQQYEDAEHAVATASAAAAEATSAEDRLEEEVRDLEQRLTQARADLAAARMRARRAQAAERRARQALDRLPGP